MDSYKTTNWYHHHHNFWFRLIIIIVMMIFFVEIETSNEMELIYIFLLLDVLKLA